MSDRPAALLADANVLIDYQSANRTILTLACVHIGPIYVLHEVLDEVEGLDAESALALGLKIAEVPTELLSEAVGLSRRLSGPDRLCFLMCREKGWTCLTNDKLLRKLCKENGVPRYWGLDLMTQLVAAGHLSRRDAIQTVNAIAASNPMITEELVSRFIARLSSK